MLDTRFPRPLGDAGNPDSWGVAVRIRVARGIGPGDVVRTAAALSAGPVLPAFAAAARELEREGVDAITTSCGFLALLQPQLQAAVQVPVVTSSLLQLPALLEAEGQVGVLTISSEYLGPEYLLCAGVPAHRLDDVMVGGVDPAGEFSAAILGNRSDMNIDQACADVVAGATALKRRAPRLRSVVLECTNMPPYAPEIRRATGLRVLGLADSPVLRRQLQPDAAAADNSRALDHVS